MLSKILNIAKWIGGVIGGVMAIGGIVTLIWTQGVKAEQKRNKESNIEVKIDRLVISDSLKTVKLDQVLTNQEEFDKRQTKINTRLDALNRSYINLLKSDQKVNELIQYLEDVKKNSSIGGVSSYKIAPESNKY